MDIPADRSKAVDLALDDARVHLVAGLAAIEAAKVMLQPPTPPQPPKPDEPDEPDEEESLPPAEPLPPVDPDPIPPTPPQPPTPPKVTGLFTTAGPKDLKPLSGRLPAQLAGLEAHRVRAQRWPNPEAAVTAQVSSDQIKLGMKPGTLPAISIKSMRQVQSYVHEVMLQTAITKNQLLPYKLADLVLAMRGHLADRSVPIPATGKYAGQLTKNVARAKAMLKKQSPNVTDEEAHAWPDQPGLLRMYYYYGDGTPTAHGWSDWIDLEVSLMLGTLAETALYFKQNERLGKGRTQQAQDFLLEFITEHLEPRQVRKAQLYFGGKAKPWYAIKALWHGAIRHMSYCACTYQLTGEAYWSNCADEIWAALKKDIFRFTFPDGRDGIAFPHFTNGIMQARGQGVGGNVWHNTVYNAEAAPGMLISALLNQGTFTIKDTADLATTFYHTTFQYGWDGNKANWKVARDIGGGGSPLPKAQRKIILTDKGVKIPAPYHIGGLKDGKPSTDSFIVPQRGMMLIGAAYTDIPDYEAKLEHLKKTSSGERRGTHLPLALFEAKRQGKLPGVN